MWIVNDSRLLSELDLTGVESSYKENRYGDLFYALTIINKPQTVVELGTYLGYSALHIAAALYENGCDPTDFYLIDLWDAYPYRHCSLETTRNHFERNGLLDADYLTHHWLNQDALEAHERFLVASIDLLHIDISNDGQSLQQCLQVWHDKLRPGATLLLEGGSRERDQIEWMQRYSKRPIREFLNSEWFRSRYQFTILDPFPSLTIARKLP